MRTAITIDLEHDCPPFLSTYRGVEEGVPSLLKLFAEEGVAATFFTTGDVARRYPSTIDALVAAGHELGCHGDTHRRFSDLSETEARAELAASAATLRKHGTVTSFRAPNLDLPEAYLPLLAEAGFRLDSSQGRHKMGTYFIKPHRRAGITRVPASISPSPLRAPGLLRDALCRLLDDPAVLFFHPWEFVDLTRAPIRWDCRVRTGEPALYHLRQTIRFFRSRGAQIVRMQELEDAAPAA